MRRTKLILDIRPELHLNASKGPHESFQNMVLRPILKLQHEIIMKSCEEMVLKFDSKFKAFKREERLVIIRQTLSADAHNRRFLLGLVIGMFTYDELVYYFANQKEVQKRVYSMIQSKCEDLSILP